MACERESTRIPESAFCVVGEELGFRSGVADLWSTEQPNWVEGCFDREGRVGSRSKREIVLSGGRLFGEYADVLGAL